MKKIFLSYGRKDAAAVADRVAEYLRAHDYTVWQDRPELEPGVPFLDKIQREIQDSDVLVAILSPHSVRQAGEVDALDSVCLDELSMARFSPTPTPVVPAMAVLCEVPMVIYRLQYVDLSDSGDRDRGLADLLAGIEAALVGKIGYRSWVDSLRPWDFEPILREKRTQFVGREWLNERMNTWLETKDNEPALLITGDPGCGKSAFAATIVERNPRGLLGYHFCQSSTPETLKPGRFVRSIAAMIASRLPQYEARLSGLLGNVLDEAACHADPFSAFEAGVLAPLSNIDSPPERGAFLLIDALDEALELQDEAGAATIVALLSDRLNRFPAWLKIIATTRKNASLLRRLRGLRYLDVDVQSEANLDDVESYVRTRCTNPSFAQVIGGDVSRVDQLVAAMREVGNFLVVVQTLNALERGQAQLDNLDALPPGLYGIYEGFFSRSFPHDVDPAPIEAVLTVLTVVLAAQEPPTEKQLSQVTGLDIDEELPSALKQLAPFLPPGRSDDGSVRYAVYHKSFSDWLQDPDLRGTRFYVSVNPGHKRFATVFVEEYNQGLDSLSPYSFAHGPLHLVSAGEHDILYEALTDCDFVCAHRDHVGIVGLLESYTRAIVELPGSAKRRALAAIEGALRLSLPLVLREPSEFEMQLEVRLRGIDTLDMFRKRIRARIDPQVLIPDTNPLTPTGGPLITSLDAGFAVTAVCVHEGQGVLITGDEEGQIRSWSLQDGASLHAVKLPHMSFSCGVADPVRPMVALGTFEGLVVRFDLESGTVLSRKSQYDVGNDLYFGPGGDSLLSAHKGGLICWSWPDLEPNWRREFDGEEVEAVQMSEGGSIYIATCSRFLRLDNKDGQTRILRNAPPLEVVEPWNERTTETYTTMALRSDGTAALGRGDGKIEILSPGDDAQVRILQGHPIDYYSTSVSGVAFLGNEELVSAGWDDALRVWNVDTGEELRSVRGNSKVYDLAVFDRGRRAVTGHKMMAANVWDLTMPGCVQGEQSYPRHLSVCEEARIAVASVGSRHAKVWELGSWESETFEFEGYISAVGLDAGSHEVMVATDKDIRVIDLRNKGDSRMLASVEIARFQDAIWSPSGRLLAVDRDGEILLWRRDAESSYIELPRYESTVYTMSLTDNRLAFSTGGDVRFYDLDRKNPNVKAKKLMASPSCSALSPDGKLFAIGDEEGNVIGFDAHLAKEIWRFSAAESWVSSVSVANSGMLCVIVEDQLSVYDATAGARLAHLRSENRWGASWVSEDGRTVLAGGSEGTLHRLRRAG